MTASPPDSTLDAAHGRAAMTMGYFRLLLRSFGDTPERQDAILAGTGVTQEILADPGAEISLFQQVRQMDNLADLIGESWVVDRPELWNHPSHGALGVAALSGPDLAAAIEVIARFSSARAPFARVKLQKRAAAWTLGYELLVALTARQARALTEATLLSVHAEMAAVLGRTPRGVCWVFPGAEPGYGPRLREVLGGEVTYGGTHAAVTIPAAELAAPSPFASPSLHARAIEELEEAQRQASRPSDLRARVERLLATMPPGRLDAASTARALGVSRRTLVRRLAESGSGFRDLLDAELRRRARRLLDAGDLTHAEIAERLGYAEPTSFSRACRRWFR